LPQSQTTRSQLYYVFFSESSGSACEILLGKDCIDNEEPLVALSILPDSIRKDTFAVVFSVSHTIIDGCTYYSLLSMISADGKPPVMKFARSKKTWYRWKKRSISRDNRITIFW
jgi:hypothetical protein